MVESLLYRGARAGSGEKIPGAGQKRTGSATLTSRILLFSTTLLFQQQKSRYVIFLNVLAGSGSALNSAGSDSTLMRQLKLVIFQNARDTYKK